MNHLAQFPFLPVSLYALSESAFFASKDAEVVKAGFYMLNAAWSSSKPGSIAATFSALATITRLSEAQVEANYACLTAEWDLHDDGRLHHAQLEAICQSIQERFGAQLAVLADAAVVAVQGGKVGFELLPATEVVKKKRGKHLLPKDFSFDKATLEHAIKEGFTTPEYQSWLVRSFSDFAAAKAVMYTNWQAACRNFISSDITRKQFHSKFRHFPGAEMSLSTVPLVPSGLSSAQDRLRNILSFQERTIRSNSEKMHAPSRFLPEGVTATSHARNTDVNQQEMRA